ncbi:MAG: PTS sugar transporter subunit IIC [Candidatus Adiutrix sp.]
MFFSQSLLGGIFLGALINLDKQVFGPFMFNRPLVAGLLIGLWLGEVKYGIWLGLSAELLWLATLPLGGQIIPNGGLAVSASLIAWFASDFGPLASAPTESGLVLSFLTLPLWAKAFTLIDIISRKGALGQVERAAQALDEGREPNFFLRNLFGVAVTFGGAIGLQMVAVGLNVLILNKVAQFMPESTWVTISALYTFVPFVGLLIMAVSVPPRTLPYYLAGLVASLLAISSIY